MTRRAGTALAWSWITLLIGALLLIAHWPDAKTPLGDEATYLHAARQIAAGHDPELPQLWPPFYPRFVAATLALGGGTLWILQLVQLALLFATAALSRDLCSRLLGDTRVGNAVAFGVLGYPPLVAFATWPRPEVLHLALLAVALWIVVAHPSSRAWALGLGAVLGLSLSTRSLLGPIIPVFLVPLARAGPRGERAVRVALAVLAVALTLVPGALDDWRNGRSWALAGSGWFNLWVGLNDHSRRDLQQPIVGREYAIYQASASTWSERNAIIRAKIARFTDEHGAVEILRDQLGRQYFRFFDKDSYLTAQLPGGVVAGRGGGYRDPPATLAKALRSVSFTSYALLLVATALGIAVFPVRARPWIWIALTLLGYHALLFLFLHVKSRYRVPCLPFFFFFAAYGVDRWRVAGSPSVGRLFAAGVGAATALALAFGAALLG